MTRLIIKDLVAEQFRKFEAPTRLAGLGPGLNLLTDDNDAGKSTLKAALDAVFFQRHRLTGKDAAAMANRWNDVPPALQVGFALDGAEYTLAKRFVRQQRAILTRPDGSLAEGEAAEQEMQRLLGFAQAGRGSVKPEHLGIWGLLWLSQGDSLAEVKVEESAKGPLQESLVQGEVAAITGGRRGQRVPQAVKTALAEHVTATGRPTGRRAALRTEIESTEKAHKDATALREALAERLDALARSRRDLASDENAADPEAEKAEIAAARTAVQAARALAGRLEHASTELALARQQHEAASRDLEQRQALVNNAAEHASALSQAHAETEATAKAEQAALAARTQAETAAATAQEAAKTAETRLKTARALAERSEKRQRLEAQKDTLSQAIAAAREAQEARREAQASLATPDALKQLRTLATKRDAARAARAAAATRLRFSLSSDGAAKVSLAGEPVAPDATVDLLQPTLLSFADLGQVEIVPGVQDGQALDLAADQAEANFSDALGALGAPSLNAAEALAEQRAQLLQRANAATERARVLAPDYDGPGALTEALAEVEAALQTLAADTMQDDMAAETDDEDTLREAANLALAQSQQAEAARGEARQAAALARQAREQAEKVRGEVEARQAATLAKLAAAREQIGDDALGEAVPNALAKVEEAEANLGNLRHHQAEQGEVQGLEARLERLEVARDRRQQRVETLKLTIARLETEIRSQSDRGPDEIIADADTTLIRLGQERDAIERRVAALQRLDAALSEARTKVEAQYLAPVTAKLGPHLATLFGEASVGLNSDFGLQELHRGQRAEAVSDLSDGTREQLAILARIAFAEVLAEQGRPVVLVLDDVLVYADDRRIDDMFTALERAAERMQVIVLSCRQRVFDGLGGRAQRRLSIEPADPIAF